MVPKALTDEFIEKTIKEFRKNIARREQEAFGKGILWTVFVTWIAQMLNYALGNNPGPGIMIGPLIVGLYYRYKKGR